MGVALLCLATCFSFPLTLMVSVSVYFAAWTCVYTDNSKGYLQKPPKTRYVTAGIVQTLSFLVSTDLWLYLCVLTSSLISWGSVEEPCGYLCDSLSLCVCVVSVNSCRRWRACPSGSPASHCESVSPKTPSTLPTLNLLKNWGWGCSPEVEACLTCIILCV